MKPFFTVSEVAALADCSVSTIRRAVDAGRLGAIRIGKHRGPRRGGSERLFAVWEVERFLKDWRAKAGRGKQRRKGKRT